MNSDEIALLKAIQASPEDDLPRLIYADYCLDYPTPWRTATEEFIRLSVVEQPAPKVKTRRDDCSFCHEGETDEWVSIAIGHVTRTCLACGGKGWIESSYTTNQRFPRKASEWLEVNWRRLVPRLTSDWDKAAVLATPGMDLPAQQDGLTGWARQEKAGLYHVGVPFILPSYHDPGFRCYTCSVRLQFRRGFLETARWRAPSLGPRIATDISFDQPLALQYGPGFVENPLTYVAPGE